MKKKGINKLVNNTKRPKSVQFPSLFLLFLLYKSINAWFFLLSTGSGSLLDRLPLVFGAAALSDSIPASPSTSLLSNCPHGPSLGPCPDACDRASGRMARRGVVSCGPVLPSCEDEWSSVTWAALQRPALCVRKVPVINGGGRMKNEFIYGQVLREG